MCGPVSVRATPFPKGEARDQREDLLALPAYEVINAVELARRWAVPESWVRDNVRSRTADPIPHVRLGRYVRFEWESADLESWWARRRKPAAANPQRSKPTSVTQGIHGT